MANIQQKIDAPAANAFAITPNDSTVFTRTRGLYVGTGGDLAVRMSGGTSVTFPDCVSGMVYPFSVDKVLSSGTTATSIVGLY